MDEQVEELVFLPYRQPFAPQLRDHPVEDTDQLVGIFISDRAQMRGKILVFQKLHAAEQDMIRLDQLMVDKCSQQER